MFSFWTSYYSLWLDLKVCLNSEQASASQCYILYFKTFTLRLLQNRDIWRCCVTVTTSIFFRGFWKRPALFNSLVFVFKITEKMDYYYFIYQKTNVIGNIVCFFPNFEHIKLKNHKIIFRTKRTFFCKYV